MVCLRNICINTLHKGDNDDYDDDNNNNNNNNLRREKLLLLLLLLVVVVVVVVLTIQNYETLHCANNSTYLSLLCH